MNAFNSFRPLTLLRQPARDDSGRPGKALWLATGRNGVLGFAGFRKDAPRLAVGCFTFSAGRLFAALVGVLWLGTPILRADRYVATNGTGNSSSWALATSNIQWAVNAAAGGETVWVSNGTYCLTNQIEITNNVTVQSTNGYSNTLVYAGWPTYTTRCFYVVNTGIVDGFTISNGHYIGSNTYDGGGGAFVATNGRIQNCYFANNICSNAATSSGGGGAYIGKDGIISDSIFYTNGIYFVTGGSQETRGGGIRVEGGGSVFNCQVISNYSVGTYNGAGIAIRGVSGTQNIVSNCLIAYSGGSAGMYIRGPGNQSMAINCTIRNGATVGVAMDSGQLKDCFMRDNNSCGVRGGSSDICYLTNCVITGNRGNAFGAGVDQGCGGISYQAGLWGSKDYIIVDNCVISNNICSYGIGGGGVFIETGGLLRNCLIHNNTNTHAGGYGGGLYLTNAGAMAQYTTGVFNCTIVNNYSTNDGGGICARGSTNYIVNCIIASNSSSSNNYPNIYNADVINTNNFYYSCVNTNLAPNQENITNDPVFAGAGAGNWRLANNSPCMNTGTNMSWMTNAYDLDGRTRIRYERVDMGAYERINEGTVYGFR